MDTQTTHNVTIKDKFSNFKRFTVLLGGLVFIFGIACEEANESDTTDQELTEDQMTLWGHSCGHCGSSHHCSNEDDEVVRVVKRVVIMSKSSEKVATANRDDSVTQERLSWFHRCKRRAQKWTLKQLDTGEYEIINRKRGKCLGIIDDSTFPEKEAVMQDCTRSGSQLWNINASGDYFEIINVNSDFCLTVEGDSLDDGATLIQFPCDGRDSQQWTMFGFELNE